jgi:hypothetical protein
MKLVSEVSFPWDKGDYILPSSAEVMKSGVTLHSPICLHGIVLNELSTGQLFFFNSVL